ncbi:MAG: hypothetical protein JO064_06220 [Actinobacteria bacterium]|nr:hypothetical protein [Actinomycetota bacterium]
MRIVVQVALGALVAAVLAAPGTAARAAQRSIVIYSQTTREEFNNHSDDRVRGDLDNPFGKTQSAATAAGQIGRGPFAGDRAVFTFNLYSDAGLGTSIGSATFDCQYAFATRGICQAEWDFNGGIVLGMGFIDFNAKTFALAVIGGSGKYRDARGDVFITPDQSKRGNKLAFTLL